MCPQWSLHLRSFQILEYETMTHSIKRGIDCACHPMSKWINEGRGRAILSKSTPAPHYTRPQFCLVMDKWINKGPPSPRLSQWFFQSPLRHTSVPFFQFCVSDNTHLSSIRLVLTLFSWIALSSEAHKVLVLMASVTHFSFDTFIVRLSMDWLGSSREWLQSRIGTKRSDSSVRKYEENVYFSCFRT